MMTLGGVIQQPAEGAGQRYCADAPAAWRARVRQKLGDFDGIVERVGADDAEFAGDGVERFDRTGERAGMRHGGAAALLRLAELDRNDRLAGGAGVEGCGLELVEVRDRLDVDDDDFQFRLIGKERDVIGNAQAGFIAAGDQIFGVHAALFERGVHEQHHTAALSDQRHRPLPQGQRPVFRERHETRLGADVAHAVRAGDGEPGLGDHVGQFAPKFGGILIEGLAETRREDRCAARSRGGAAAQQFRHTRRRHQDDEVVRRLRQRLEVRVASFVENLGPARIDQISGFRKVIAFEIAPHPRRPASRAIARADENGIARFGQRRDLLL